MIVLRYHVPTCTATQCSFLTGVVRVLDGLVSADEVKYDCQSHNYLVPKKEV
jgi:hypothetical protein